MSLAAGSLNHFVTIQHLVQVVDSNGDVVQDPATGEVSSEWATFAEVWAKVEPLSGREFIQAAAAQSQITARITIRARDGVNASMRIVDGPRTYNIMGVLPDPVSGQEYMTLPCSEGTNLG